MFTLKVIFVILLMIPLIILAFLLLNKLFDSAIKYKDKPVNEESSTGEKKSNRKRQPGR